MSVIKESQIGAYLATQNVTLDAEAGMTVTANYTLAFDHVNRSEVGSKQALVPLALVAFFRGLLSHLHALSIPCRF
jgi:hypothetical protein